MAGLAAIVSWVFFAGPSLHAQQPKPSEYQVKAAYIYNFGRFVTWPANATAEQDGSFAICVLGKDPFGPVLDSTLAGESLDGKPVAIRRLQKPQDAPGCRILFINSTEENHLHEILTALDDEAILTVSDMPDFSRRGGMIQFVLDGERVRFEVNLARAENAKLTLSSELLKVAASVRKSARSGY
ncbi:MAG: YfiR family protein [Acidobacteriia bacterium]|nr:YfiR family protein [Terriglobia bacterium]